MDLVGAALAQGVLPEEEHEASRVFVHGAPLGLYQPDTLDDVDELDLLVPRQLWQRYLGQLLAD